MVVLLFHCSGDCFFFTGCDKISIGLCQARLEIIKKVVPKIEPVSKITAAIMRDCAIGVYVDRRRRMANALPNEIDEIVLKSFGLQHDNETIKTKMKELRNQWNVCLSVVSSHFIETLKCFFFLANRLK